MNFNTRLSILYCTAKFIFLFNHFQSFKNTADVLVNICTVIPLLFMAKMCLYKTIAEEVPIDFLNKNRKFILKFSFSMCFDGSDYDEWEAYVWNNFFLSQSFVILICIFYNHIIPRQFLLFHFHCHQYESHIKKFCIMYSWIDGKFLRFDICDLWQTILLFHLLVLKWNF